MVPQNETIFLEKMKCLIIMSTTLVSSWETINSLCLLTFQWSVYPIVTFTLIPEQLFPKLECIPKGALFILCK